VTQDDISAVEILLVEDNEDDAALTARAFRKARMRNRLSVVPDGVEALAYLRKEGKYSGAVRPDLILLDLNLPRLGGRQVLERIKADPGLRDIPVIILTTSKAEEDVALAYKSHTNCFISKPVVMEEFERTIKEIADFWFVIVRLPRREK